MTVRCITAATAVPAHAERDERVQARVPRAAPRAPHTPRAPRPPRRAPCLPRRRRPNGLRTPAEVRRRTWVTTSRILIKNLKLFECVSNSKFEKLRG